MSSVTLCLSKMVSFTADKYGTKRDASGQTMLLHPLAVMSAMHTDTERIIALAHDLVEDKKCTYDELRGLGFTEGMVFSVDCLTHRDDETYEEYINRVKLDSIAIKVKIADLENNFDIRRLKNRRHMTMKDLERLNRYADAWSSLTGR